MLSETEIRASARCEAASRSHSKSAGHRTSHEAGLLQTFASASGQLLHLLW